MESPLAGGRHSGRVMISLSFPLVKGKIMIISGFPLGLENLGKGEGIFQSGNFEQTGKFRENHIKY